MGYYTYHTLTIQPSVPVGFSDRFEQVTDYEFEALSNDSIKWYDSDSNMKQLSAEFPDCLFILGGDGEESGDKWKAYYYRGNACMCRAVLTFPKPDLVALGNPDIHSPELFI